MREVHGYGIEDLAVGMTAASAKTMSDADIVLFSGLSGDTNPLHHDREYAAGTRFGDRIAPGMLTASLVSAVFGSKLPGPGCVYLSQTLRFLAPVYIGDTVLARVTVTELMPQQGRAAFSTVCTVGERKVLDGDALMLVPARTPGDVPLSPRGASPGAAPA